ncbi:MAG: ABC transporter substrate-binding protein [Bacteroidales bacterium]|nr:ABC transporter substrate-binding protein [Bacteroidales bacterium]
MKRYFGFIFFASLLAIAAGCRNNNSSSMPQSGSIQNVADIHIENDTAKIAVNYAKGFKVNYLGNLKLVEISDPSANNPAVYKFALGEDISGDIPQGYTPIKIPVNSVICMTTLQLAGFITLGETGKVSGMSSTRFLHNATVRKQIEEGITRRIGIEGNFDNEVIMNINPNLIYFSPFKRGGYDGLKEAGIPLVPHLGYKEPHPLGQAEWIKFIALFINEEAKANRIFNDIAQQYNTLKEKVAQQQVERPVVLSGEIHGGSWYAVGGKSFLAQLFKDAGADYVLKDNNESGGINFDFETMYEKAANAQYWRIMNGYQGEYTYEVLGKSDPRYKDFRAYREKGVIYCNQREKGFYESSPTQPHLVLKDLVKIFHPTLVEEDYKGTFYTLLEK